MKIQLIKIAHARSGDKGDTANIGLIAKEVKYYQILKKYVTADLVKEIFSDRCFGKVTRYELENLNALNFVLEKSLGGGGTRSLRNDSQGKTFSSVLLKCEIEIIEEMEI